MRLPVAEGILGEVTFTREQGEKVFVALKAARKGSRETEEEDDEAYEEEKNKEAGEDEEKPEEKDEEILIDPLEEVDTEPQTDSPNADYDLDLFDE